MPSLRRVGFDAEDAAAEFLAGQGYLLLKRRFRAGGGEVDLIGLEGDVLAFVEVKLRRGKGKEPLEALDLAKQERIFAASEVYLGRYDGPPCQVRYDVVTAGPKGFKLFRDAFRPR
jgi:putative endonuclease